MSEYVNSVPQLLKENGFEVEQERLADFDSGKVDMLLVFADPTDEGKNIYLFSTKSGPILSTISQYIQNVLRANETHGEWWSSPLQETRIN